MSFSRGCPVDKLDKITERTLLSIYDEFYKSSNETCLDVFLCGKGKTRGGTSLRDTFRERLKNEKNIRVLYPEDLFVDIFNKKKHYDMLSMEKFLANNCDVICIICEDNSPGAFVELGAFTNHSDTFEKVLVMVQRKYKSHKSFIMLGPIKYIQQRNKDNVLYYTSDMDDSYKELLKRLKSKLKLKDRSDEKDIDSIIGQYYFILMVIYFYGVISVKNLVRYVKYVVDARKIQIMDFDLLYSAALKQLYKDKMIEKNIHQNADFYSLTDKGKTKYYKTFNSLRLAQKTKKSDFIRLSILAHQYY